MLHDIKESLVIVLDMIMICYYVFLNVSDVRDTYAKL